MLELVALPLKVLPSEVKPTVVDGNFRVVFDGIFFTLMLFKSIFICGLILSKRPFISAFIDIKPEFIWFSFIKAA